MQRYLGLGDRSAVVVHQQRRLIAVRKADLGAAGARPVQVRGRRQVAEARAAQPLGRPASQPNPGVG